MQNVMFRKDNTNVDGKLIPVNPLMEESFIRVGTDIAYCNEVHAFIDSIPEVG